MVLLRPEHPSLANGAERQVWELLRDQLGPDDALISGLRISDRTKDHEADFVVVMPGAGGVVVEVKGGSVWHDSYRWRQARGGSEVTIDPVEQVLKTHYALRAYVEADPRWRDDDRRRARWAHAIVVPNTTLPTGFSAPECPRWMISDATDLDDLVQRLRNILLDQDTSTRPMDADDVATVVEILGGYVGEFHRLGQVWGATPGSDDDSDYWESRLPAQMRDLAAELPSGERFDAVVIDEAQDFADAWWPAVLASLRDEDTGGIYVFSDEGQRVFARFGQAPVPLVPLMLDHNLRNTRQIAGTFNSLATMRMKLFGGDGPAVRFVECEPRDALGHGDDAVDALLDEGWRPEDIALLTTGSRHPEQAQRQAAGQDEYWESFWDADQVFYGHVLGFKGLERRAVVLVLNESQVGDRSRERLYVGLSRARDQLVVCGSSERIRELGGEAVLRQVSGSAAPVPKPPAPRV